MYQRKTIEQPMNKGLSIVAILFTVSMTLGYSQSLPEIDRSLVMELNVATLDSVDLERFCDTLLTSAQLKKRHIDVFASINSLASRRKSEHFCNQAFETWKKFDDRLNSKTCQLYLNTEKSVIWKRSAVHIRVYHIECSQK